MENDGAHSPQDVERMKDRIHELQCGVAEANHECFLLHRGLAWLSLALGIDMDAHWRKDFFWRAIFEIKRLKESGPEPGKKGDCPE